MSKTLLPGFLMAGFECSTPINSKNCRIDEMALTQHDRYVNEDYQMLSDLGIRAVRDGVRWNLIDQRGRLDFSTVIPFLDAARARGLTVIWDLFHYGYPDDLDPFDDELIMRFADYCYSFARLVEQRDLPPFYTPINEISFFAWAACEGDRFAPRASTRGPELKRQLVRAALAGMDAILSVNPQSRFVNCDPLVYVVAPTDAPHLEDQATYFNEQCVLEAWDMLGGYREPELGGSPRHLDIIGINYYGHNQWEHTRPHCVLSTDDPRRLPFSDLLLRMHERYGRPLVVSETSSHGEYRASWLRRIGDECLRAIDMGVDLQSLCVYPVIDMFEWSDLSGPLRMGLWELCPSPDEERLERVAHQPMMAEVQRLQAKVLSRNPARQPAGIVG